MESELEFMLLKIDLRCVNVMLPTSFFSNIIFGIMNIGILLFKKFLYLNVVISAEKKKKNRKKAVFLHLKVKIDVE